MIWRAKPLFALRRRHGLKTRVTGKRVARSASRERRVRRESDGIEQACGEVFCGGRRGDAGGGVRAGVSPVDSGEAAGGASTDRRGELRARTRRAEVGAGVAR